MTFEDVLIADNSALFDPDVLGMPGASVETVDYMRDGSILASGISINIERGDISRAKEFRGADGVSPQTNNGVAFIPESTVAAPKYQDKIIATDGIWTVLGRSSTEAGIYEAIIEKDLAPRF